MNKQNIKYATHFPKTLMGALLALLLIFGVFSNVAGLSSLKESGLMPLFDITVLFEGQLQHISKVPKDIQEQILKSVKVEIKGLGSNVGLNLLAENQSDFGVVLSSRLGIPLLPKDRAFQANPAPIFAAPGPGGQVMLPLSGPGWQDDFVMGTFPPAAPSLTPEFVQAQPNTLNVILDAICIEAELNPPGENDIFVVPDEAKHPDIFKRTRAASVVFRAIGELEANEVVELRKKITIEEDMIFGESPLDVLSLILLYAVDCTENPDGADVCEISRAGAAQWAVWQQTDNATHFDLRKFWEERPIEERGTQEEIERGIYHILDGVNLILKKAGIIEEIHANPNFPTWDVNWDYIIDIQDMRKVGSRYREANVEPDFGNPDVNRDGVVNVIDLVLVGQRFGEKYNGAEAPAPPLLSNLADTIKVWIQPGEWSEETFTATIMVEHASELAGYQFDLVYDAEAFEVISVNEGTLLNGSGETYRLPTKIFGGQLRLGSVRLEPDGVDGSGALATIHFKVNAAKLNADTLTVFPPLQLENVKLVDAEANLIPVTVASSMPYWEKKLIPTTSQLLPNYPNPFNPETWIPYKLAYDTEVTIRIYNMRGELIQTLPLGNRSAGSYLSKTRAAYWDGENSKGEAVSSGIYFYRLDAGKFSATRRMVLLR
ncbi:T9SS type A sorting domain-containing protein [Candidatus Poribacteria bacterium]|nr:T9SS type A sorting domain-containing protein [Candidatus Poribacteria bacterium]